MCYLNYHLAILFSTIPHSPFLINHPNPKPIRKGKGSTTDTRPDSWAFPVQGKVSFNQAAIKALVLRLSFCPDSPTTARNSANGVARHAPPSTKKSINKGEQTIHTTSIPIPTYRLDGIECIALCCVASRHIIEALDSSISFYLFVHSFVGFFSTYRPLGQGQPAELFTAPPTRPSHTSIPPYPVCLALPYLPDWEPTVQGKHLPSSTYYLRPSLPTGTPATTVLLTYSTFPISPFHYSTFLLLSFFFFFL